MAYTFENIMAADIPAYAIGASRFATQVGTVAVCAGMAGRAYGLLDDSYRGDARGAQLGDAATVASAAAALAHSSSQLLAQLSETEVRLAAAKGKVMAVLTAAQAPPGPFGLAPGGVFYLLPHHYDPFTVEANAAACLAHNESMQAAIALANGEDVRSNLQTCAIGLDLAATLKTVFSPPGGPGADGGSWAPPPAVEGIDVPEPVVATSEAGPSRDGHYQGLTSDTPPPVAGPASGASSLGAAPAIASGVSGGAISAGTAAGGGFLGVPGVRGQRRDGDEGPEVRQWSLTEETDEFWRSPNAATTNGVLT